MLVLRFFVRWLFLLGWFVRGCFLWRLQNHQLALGLGLSFVTHPLVNSLHDGLSPLIIGFAIEVGGTVRPVDRS